MEKSFYKKLEK